MDPWVPLVYSRGEADVEAGGENEGVIVISTSSAGDDGKVKCLIRY